MEQNYEQLVCEVLPAARCRKDRKTGIFRIFVGAKNTVALAASELSPFFAWRFAAYRIGVA